MVKMELSLNIYDEVGAIDGVVPVGLTIQTITEIVDHASHIATMTRIGDPNAVEEIIHELDAVLTEAGVLDRKPSSEGLAGTSGGATMCPAAGAGGMGDRIRTVQSYETLDGKRHDTLAMAEAHDAELLVQQVIGELGLGNGGTWTPRMIQDAILDAADRLGPLLMGLANRRRALEG